MHIHRPASQGSVRATGIEEHLPSGPESDRYSERLTALRVLLEEVTGVLVGDTHYRLPDLEYEEDPDEYHQTIGTRQ